MIDLTFTDNILTEWKIAKTAETGQIFMYV
jgi:hypothetical protein